MPGQVELDQGHGLADGGDLAFVLGIAPLVLGLIEQYAVNPARLARLVTHRTAAFPDPVLASKAVIETVLDRIAATGMHRLQNLFGNARAIIRMEQLGDRLTPFREVLRRPASQHRDGVADEQHAPVVIQQAAKGHAGNIADQRAVLLFALAYGLLHGLALADITDETDIQHLSGQLCAADSQAQRQELAILV